MEDFNLNQNVPVVKTSDWFLTILITAIPLVGLIMLFVWAFGGGNNTNKANWAKASLLWMLISIIIGIFIFLVMGAAMFSIFNS